MRLESAAGLVQKACFEVYDGGKAISILSLTKTCRWVTWHWSRWKTTWHADCLTWTLHVEPAASHHRRHQAGYCVPQVGGSSFSSTKKFFHASVVIEIKICWELAQTFVVDVRSLLSPLQDFARMWAPELFWLPLRYCRSKHTVVEAIIRRFLTIGLWLRSCGYYPYK